MRLRNAVVTACAIGAFLGFTMASRASDRPDIDDTRLARLQASLHDITSVRIVTGGETVLAEQPMASPEGLTVSGLTVRKGFTYETRHDPKLIPWTEIEAIETRGHRTRRGASLGALFGSALGFGIGAYQPCHSGFVISGTSGNCAQRKLTPLLLGVVGGAAIGGILGNHYEQWRPIYP